MTRFAGDKVTIPVEKASFKPGEVSLNPNAEHKGSASFKPGEQPAGIQTYLETLKQETRRLLNRDISELEEWAIEQANRTGRVEDSKKSEWALIREKADILQKARFSKQEIRQLIESGIVWTRDFTTEEQLINNLGKGQGYLIINRTDIARIISRERKEHKRDFRVEMDLQYLDGEFSNYTFPSKHSPLLSFTHPDTYILFESAKLKKEQVNREDINLPPPTYHAEELKQQGYGPAWTKGIDKLNEWVEVRKQLQSLRANPYTTHIPYFADQIKSHLAFATKVSDTMSEQKKQELANLKAEVKTVVLNERVTYEWWVDFNIQLSTVLSSKSNPEIVPLLEQAKIIPLFPLRMAVPTIQGELGIITLNRAQSEGIYPLGLINQPKQVEGKTLLPLGFMLHDILHTYHQLFKVDIVRYSTGHRLRHKKILALMENLPPEKRKRAELIYFLSTHETSRDFLLGNQPREGLAKLLTSVFDKNLYEKTFTAKMAGLGKEYFDIKVDNERIQYIKDRIIANFMREVHRPAF